MLRRLDGLLPAIKRGVVTRLFAEPPHEPKSLAPALLADMQTTDDPSSDETISPDLTCRDTAPPPVLVAILALETWRCNQWPNSMAGKPDRKYLLVRFGT